MSKTSLPLPFGGLSLSAGDRVVATGASGSGKTEVAMAMLAQCALSPAAGGAGQRAAYVDADYRLDVARLAAVVAGCAERHAAACGVAGTGRADAVDDALGRIFIVRCDSSDALLLTLYQLAVSSWTLIVVDSMSAHFWQDRAMDAGVQGSFGSRGMCATQLAVAVDRLADATGAILLLTHGLLGPTTRGAQSAATDTANGGRWVYRARVHIAMELPPPPTSGWHRAAAQRCARLVERGGSDGPVRQRECAFVIGDAGIVCMAPVGK